MKKRQLTKIFRSGAAVLLAGALCGCSVKFGTNKEPKSNSKEPKSNSVVAHATSGEDYEDMQITYEQFRKEYWYVLVNSDIHDDTNLDEYLDAQCKAQREKTIKYLINEQVIMKKAKELGVYELTDEEQAEVDKQYDEMVAAQIEKWGEAAAAELAASETSGDSETSVPEISDEEKERLGKERLEQMLAECGMTYEHLKWWAQSSRIADKVYEEVVKDIPQSEVTEKYNLLVEEAKRVYADDKSSYFQVGYIDLWLPEGSRLVKHVLLGFDDDTKQKIYNLRLEDNDSEADTLREEAAAALEEKRQEVEQKLDDGAKIDDLIAEYSADKAGSAAYPDGYTVVPDDTRWMSEFTKGAFVPENIGERTVVVTDYGVHIMIYAGNAKTPDGAREKFENLILNNLKNEKYKNAVNEWIEEYAYEFDYAKLRIDDPNAETSAE